MDMLVVSHKVHSATSRHEREMIVCSRQLDLALPKLLAAERHQSVKHMVENVNVVAIRHRIAYPAWSGREFPHRTDNEYGIRGTICRREAPRPQSQGQDQSSDNSSFHASLPAELRQDAEIERNEIR